MTNESRKEDLSHYHTMGLPMLMLMALLAVAGIVATLVLSYFS